MPTLTAPLSARLSLLLTNAGIKARTLGFHYLSSKFEIEDVLSINLRVPPVSSRQPPRPARERGDVVQKIPMWVFQTRVSSCANKFLARQFRVRGDTYFVELNVAVNIRTKVVFLTK